MYTRAKEVFMLYLLLLMCYILKNPYSDASLRGGKRKTRSTKALEKKRDAYGVLRGQPVSSYPAGGSEMHDFLLNFIPQVCAAAAFSCRSIFSYGLLRGPPGTFVP